MPSPYTASCTTSMHFNLHPSCRMSAQWDIGFPVHRGVDIEMASGARVETVFHDVNLDVPRRDHQDGTISPLMLRKAIDTALHKGQRCTPIQALLGETSKLWS